MSDTLQEREDQVSNQINYELCTYSADGGRTYCGLGRGSHLYADHFFRQGQSESDFDKVFKELEAPDYPATCDNCGAEGTNESLKSHICGEHQVTKSGTCVIPGCPCRGWSAQEGASVKEVSECQSDHPWSNCPKCGIGICDEHIVAWLNHQQHQPAARGGGDEWHADESSGWGYVWQGGACLAKCPEPSRAQQIITEHNQHHSLVAERESYAQLLKAAKSLIAMNNCNYDRSVMRERGAFIELEKAVETIEQSHK